MNMTGHVCAIGVSFAFNDGPEDRKGKGVAMGSAVLSMLLTPVFMLYLRRQNAKKLRVKGSPEASALRAKSVEEIYDAHPDFLYTL